MKRILLLVPISLLVAVPALAAEFLVPAPEADPNVSTTELQTITNLYAVGATVNINGSTLGDLFAAGGMVTVNGNVEDDLMAAGGNINLNGVVGGNLRAAGGNISISSPVGFDLMAAGGNIAIAQNAKVGADLVIAGGNIVIDSNVGGKAIVTGGNVTINGKISGNLEVIANEMLTFGPNSEVVGKVTYKGRKEAVVREGAKIGVIEFTPIKKRRNYAGAILSIAMLIKFLALLVAGFVLYYFFRTRLSDVVAKAKAQPLKSLGIGFLALAATPVLIVVLFATVIGFYIAMLLALLYAYILLVNVLLTAFYAGNLVYGWYNKQATMNLKRDLVLGSILLLVICFIPLVGWLAVFVAYLITLGAVISYRLNRESMNQ